MWKPASKRESIGAKPEIHKENKCTKDEIKKIKKKKKKREKTTTKELTTKFKAKLYVVVWTEREVNGRTGGREDIYVNV